MRFRCRKELAGLCGVAGVGRCSLWCFVKLLLSFTCIVYTMFAFTSEEMGNRKTYMNHLVFSLLGKLYFRLLTVLWNRRCLRIDNFSFKCRIMSSNVLLKLEVL